MTHSGITMITAVNTEENTHSSCLQDEKMKILLLLWGHAFLNIYWSLLRIIQWALSI